MEALLPFLIEHKELILQILLAIFVVDKGVHHSKLGGDKSDMILTVAKVSGKAALKAGKAACIVALKAAARAKSAEFSEDNKDK